MDKRKGCPEVKNKPDSVLCLNKVTIIYLGLPLPTNSYDLPGSKTRRAASIFPIWSFTGWGLPCQKCHHFCGELLPHLFTLTLRGRYLFCGTFPEITFGGRYPPSCPAVSGLSSPAKAGAIVSLASC